MPTEKLLAFGRIWSDLVTFTETDLGQEKYSCLPTLAYACLRLRKLAHGQDAGEPGHDKPGMAMRQRRKIGEGLHLGIPFWTREPVRTTDFIGESAL